MFGFLRKKPKDTDHLIEHFDEYTKRCKRCGASWVFETLYERDGNWVDYSAGDKSATCYEPTDKEKEAYYQRERKRFLTSGVEAISRLQSSADQAAKQGGV